MTKWGEFIGEVRTVWVSHDGPDLNMELIDDFVFQDDNGQKWVAKKGHIINGASIPRILWSIYPGSPYVGEYRRAAAIHDSLYIEQFGGDRKAVDKAFYKAMRTDNTDWFKAKVMYIAVRLFGGSMWDDRGSSYISAENEMTFRRLIEWIKEEGESLKMDRIDEECDRIMTITSLQ